MLAVYVGVNEKWGGNCILFFCSASVNMMPSCSINVHSAKLTYLRNGKLSRNTSCTCWNLLVTPSALSGMFIIQKFSKIYDFTAFHTLGQRLIRVHKLMKYSLRSFTLKSKDFLLDFQRELSDTTVFSGKKWVNAPVCIHQKVV